MPGSLGFADIAGVVSIVDFVGIEVVGTAGAAAGTADIVAATEWQPLLAAPTLCFCFFRQQNTGPGLRSRRNL